MARLAAASELTSRPSGRKRRWGCRKEISPQGDIGCPSTRFRSGGRSPARQATFFGARPPSSGDEQASSQAKLRLFVVVSLPAVAGTRLEVAKLHPGAASKRGGARRKASRAWVNRPEDGVQPIRRKRGQSPTASHSVQEWCRARFADICRCALSQTVLLRYV